MIDSDITEIVFRLKDHANAFTGKRILVTGARGFLGRHVVAALAKLPCEVIACDRWALAASLGAMDVPKAANIEAVDHDVTKPFPVHGKVDFIFSLAGIASPVHYKRLPLETLAVCVDGTRNMLDLAMEKNASIVVASSSEVYGDPDPAHVPTSETYWGNVNCASPRACFSEDTEILTADGWVKFPELREGVAVATLREDRSVEYVVPVEVIRKSFVGEMIRFSNSKMDLLVTPNHRMVSRSRRTGEREFRRADESISWGHQTCPVGGKWSEVQPLTNWTLAEPARNAKVSMPPIDLDLWLEFLGYYLAEGCVTVTKRNRVVNGTDYETRDHRILIAHGHNWKRSPIETCLRKLPWRFQELDHQFQIVNRQLADSLECFGRKSIKKHLSREILDLPPSKLKILFNAMMLDGSRRGNAFYTSSDSMVGDFQELALKIGYATSVRVVEDQSKNPFNAKTAYVINLRPSVDAKYPTPSRVRYAGNVYCVDAPPNRTVFVRRRGKVVVSGNCYDEGKRVAETLCWIYHDKFKTRVKVVRPFNSYGPGLSPFDYRVLSKFAGAIVKGERLHVYGHGNQTRTFCYVTDTVVGVFLALLKGKDGEAYNVGTSSPEVSIHQLALAMESAAKRDTEQFPIEYVAPPEEHKEEPQRRCPDIRKLSAIGFAPEVPLGEGLGRFLKWAESVYPKAAAPEVTPVAKTTTSVATGPMDLGRELVIEKKAKRP